MAQTRQWWQAAGRTLLFVGCVCLWPAAAVGRSPTPEELRLQAEQAEARGDWAQAVALYEQLPARVRSQPEIRRRHLIAARHAQRTQRHRDPSYQHQASQLTLSHALAIYEEVLHKLQGAFVERVRAEIGRLYRHGLDELALALADPEFSRTYLTAGTEALREFQAHIVDFWAERKVRRAREAAIETGLLAQAAEEALGALPALVVLEMACGACTALDEHTQYLSPGRFAEMTASLKGEAIGIGIELVAGHQKLMIAQVLPGSPAEMAGLKAGDYVLRLDGRAAADLTTEVAATLLAGEAGTTITLEVMGRDETEARVLALPRQSVRVPSVTVPRFVGTAGVAYIQIMAFNEATPRELDEALRELRMAGMKALVLDLRGNPGGLFPSALDIVNRFLPRGVVVATQGQGRELNRKHEAQGSDPLSVPLVVLVNGATASVAELVAGALKENGRATVVGQPTFGKGVLQKVRPLASASAGIQMTVARFYSPAGRPYDGTGVEPHVVISRTPPETAADMAEDAQLGAAVDAARGLVR